MRIKLLIFVIILSSGANALLAQPSYLWKESFRGKDSISYLNKDKYKNLQVKTQTAWFVKDSTKAEKIKETEKFYDEEGRIIEYDDLDRGKIASRIKYTYDSFGNRIQITDEKSFRTDSVDANYTFYKHDSLNRITNIIESYGEKRILTQTDYHYNDTDNTIQIIEWCYIVPQDSVQCKNELYRFNEMNLLVEKRAQYKSIQMDISTFEYENGSLISKNFVNGVLKSTFVDTFDSRNRCNTHFLLLPDTEARILFQDKYDENDLLTERIQCDYKGNLDQHVYFYYNSTKDLIQEDTYGQNDSLSSRRIYTYQENGLVSSVKYSYKADQDSKEIIVYTYEYYK